MADPTLSEVLAEMLDENVLSPSVKRWAAALAKYEPLVAAEARIAELDNKWREEQQRAEEAERKLAGARRTIRDQFTKHAGQTDRANAAEARLAVIEPALKSAVKYLRATVSLDEDECEELSDELEQALAVDP